VSKLGDELGLTAGNVEGSAVLGKELGLPGGQSIMERLDNEAI